MNWARIGLVAGALVSLGGLVAGSWAALDYAGVRPVLKAEFVKHTADFEVATTKLAWLEFENLEKKLSRGKLTRRECARYRGLAKTLGVEPKPC